MDSQIISPRDIEKDVSNCSIDELWSLWRNHVQTLKPFWLRTTEVFANRLNFPDSKRDTHLNAIANAFSQMDECRFQRIKYVKARRNEVDSAISFIFNNALVKPVSRLVIAPVARNAVAPLRMLLTTSCRGYSDAQIPGCFAHSIYKIAAVRVLFPFDFGSLTTFHPGHSTSSQVDPLVVMLERSGQKVGIQNEVQSLFNEVSRTWNHITNPTPFYFEDSIWAREDKGLNAQLHYASQAAFHKR